MTYQYHAGMGFQKGYTPWNKGKPECGYWLGKKRPEMRGNKNPRYTGRFPIMCLSCQKEFRVIKARKDKAKFCSHSCRATFYFKGKLNPNWKGGVSPQEHNIRGTAEYKEWRMEVFRRDWFRCRMCNFRSRKSKAHGDKTSDIHAHHIVPMNKSMELWDKLENGITLCIPCHRKTYGREENFAKVFKEILNDYTPNIPKG